MHRWASGVVVLLALAVTSPLAAPAAALTVDVWAPGPVPTDGTPFDVRVTVEGASSDVVELKAWLGGREWQASRTHNGTTFERSDRYVLDVRPREGAWTGWVTLSANPSSRNAQQLADAATGWIGVRARSPRAGAANGTAVDLLHDPDRALASVPPGAHVEAREDGLVARRSNRGQGARVLALALDPGFEGTLCLGDGTCATAGKVQLDRVGEARVRVRNVGSGPVDLATAVSVLEDGLCGLTGRLGTDGTQTFRLRDGVGTTGVPETPSLQPCPAQLPRDGHRVGQLWYRGRVVDEPPDPPAWGDVVREPFGARGWAPWRLPAGYEPRPFRMEPVEGQAVAFATEREGLQRVLQVVGAARERLTVATYLFTNPLVADALARAEHRGVDVTLLLEATPVGGMPDRERAIVADLETAGVEVRTLEGAITDHGLQHAKVIVADGGVVLVLTENLTMHGLPPDGDGNLGLGVGIANRTLAREVERLLGDPGPSRTVRLDGWRAFDGRVGVLSSPENAWRRDAVPAWVRQAGRVDGLVLRASPDWGPRRNAWLQALVDASDRRPVRVMATGTPQGARETNRLALSLVRGHPDAGDIEARLAPPRLGTVHAKALIGPEGFVVGSSNWGMGGVVLNREVNLVVQDAALAGRLGEVFDGAWNGTGSGGFQTLPAHAGPSAALALAVGAGVLALRRISPSCSGPRRGPGPGRSTRRSPDHAPGTPPSTGRRSGS